MRSLSRKIAVFFLVIGSLASSLQFLVLSGQEWIANPAPIDPVTQWDLRLQKLGRDLPPDAGFIEYIGDWDFPEVDSVFVNEETQFILTQYALAPHILVRDTGLEWIVAHLGPSALKIWTSSHQNGFEITNYGYEFYLIHRLGK